MAARWEREIRGDCDRQRRSFASCPRPPVRGEGSFEFLRRVCRLRNSNIEGGPPGRGGEEAGVVRYEVGEYGAIAVALLAAYVRGDCEGYEALLADVDPLVLLGAVAGISVGLLDQAGVRGEALIEWAERWQAERFGG